MTRKPPKPPIVHRLNARRLLGLLRAEWWAQPEDTFDLVLAAALMRAA